MAYSNKRTNFNVFKENKKIFLPIDVKMIEKLISFAITDNARVTTKNLLNLRKIIDHLDFEMFSQDFQKIIRLVLLQKVLEANLDRHLKTDTLIIEYCKDQLVEYLPTDYLPILDHCFSISNTNDEIYYISTYIEKTLKYLFVYKEAPELEEAINTLRMSSNSFSTEELTKRIEEIVERLYLDFKTSKADDKHSEQDFNLMGESAFNIIDNTIEELKKPNNKLTLGLKSLNKMFDGGLQNGRLYLLFGLPKKFKSGTLLNICIWICKYNKEIETKDKTKKPCVLYVSQENTVRETIERAYTYCTGNNIKDTVSTQEAMKVLRDEISANGIDLVIKYRPNKSINTNDLNLMCDELENDGLEVIALVHDYTKRIRPNYVTGDLRIDLGEVVNDLTVIAKDRDIPVIDAGQLNREAYRILENNISRGKADIAKDLSSSHVGESALMIENTDYAVIVNREENPETNEEYLAFKLLVSRAKHTVMKYFVQPFENGFKLKEDVLLANELSQERIVADGIKPFNPNEIRQNITNHLPPGSPQPSMVFNQQPIPQQTKMNNKTNYNLPLDTDDGL